MKDNCELSGMSQLDSDFALAWAIQHGFVQDSGSFEENGRPTKFTRTHNGRSSRPSSYREDDRQVISVRMLHISDTHSMHDEIEHTFPLPDADVLIHTGDFTNHATSAEFSKFNDWCGKMKARFKHILVIVGNHDTWRRVDFKRALTNATVLHHEMAQNVLQEFGLKIFGSPWVPSKKGGQPGGRGHMFDKIPNDVDVLLTHGPPRDIFDLGGSSHRPESWGSAYELNDAIMRAKPRVHLFGHVHEQRGVWQRDSFGKYVGGVEYEARKGKTKGPPPQDWPCDIVSCNAMAGHPPVDHEKPHIDGPARSILAERASSRDPWRFTLEPTPLNTRSSSLPSKHHNSHHRHRRHRFGHRHSRFGYYRHGRRHRV